MRADGDFPHLTPENHRITSPAAIEYNCIAWAAGDTENWWQPGVFWPIESPAGEYGIDALEAAFQALGFEPCDDPRPEPGFEKAALYGNNLLYTHAARQLPGGNGPANSARRKTSSPTPRTSWRVASMARSWRS
jgi:hypothetical protein